MFVVDASDVSRVGEARDELLSVLKDEGMEKGIPTVVGLYALRHMHRRAFIFILH